MLLSVKQKETIYSVIKETVDTLQGISNNNLSSNKQLFLDKLTEQYHSKSYNQFTYFIKNISHGYNQNTGETICNLYDKYNSYKYLPNLYIADNEKVKLQEVKKGIFLDRKQLQYANKKVAKALYIEHHCRDKNRLFITITLPSKWHYYTNKGKTKNNLCMFENYEESIQQGLIQLNHISRTLNQKINIQLKRYYTSIGKEYESYQFIKVLEYHQSLTGHLHSILYCTDEQLPIITNEYEKIVKKFELENTMCEVIKNKKASSYVYKYLLKNSLSSNNENSLFNKYKSYFSNIRIFSSSNFLFTNQAAIDKVYKYISKYRPKLMELFKKSELPLYVHLENLIKRGDFVFEYETKEQNIVNKKLLENYTLQLFSSDILPIKDSSIIYSEAIKNEHIYTKTAKIKKLTQVYHHKKLLTKTELIYDVNDFMALMKSDFKDELYGTYEDEPVF
jgi:hypothetical protein